MKFRIYKETRDKEAVCYFKLVEEVSASSIRLVAVDEYGGWRRDVLVLNENGLYRNIDTGGLGFLVDNQGRIKVNDK